MDHNIYEEMYERLLSEGLDEDIATAVVNKMHDREELHDVEYIDEGLFRAATTIGKMMLKGPAKNVAAQIGTGVKATRGTGYATMRQAQNLLNLPKSAATTRRGLRAGWTPGKALPSGRQGGALTKSGNTAGLGPVSKIEPVKVKDLGPSRVAAGKTKAATAAAGTKGTGTTYQGTRSGGQLPGKDVKALPGVGQASTRRNLAQQKLDAAAKGSTKVGTNYTSQGVRQLGPEKLASKVSRTVKNLKTTLAGAGAATLKGVKKGASAVNKLPATAKLAGGAALVGLAAAGLGGDDPLAKKTGEINLPNKDTAPTTPPGGVVADKDKKADTKGPGGYTIPDTAKPKTDGSVGKTFDPGKDLVPKSKAPRKLSKMERDARELKQMRARSLDRQGRSSDAEKLRAEIKKKYG
tara:strand:+ start:58 stop:1281 length:1224 start_codon:yes stop_codon:yes gene_type:complete